MFPFNNYVFGVVFLLLLFNIFGLTMYVMGVCVYVCMFACMYVCMCVCVCVYVY